MSELFSFYSKRNPDDTSKGRQLNVKWELICNIYIRRRLTPYLVGRARRQRYISQCEVSRISELVFFYEHVCCTDDTFREEINFAQASRSPRRTVEHDVRRAWNFTRIRISGSSVLDSKAENCFSLRKEFYKSDKKMKNYVFLSVYRSKIYILFCILCIYCVYIVYIYIGIYFLITNFIGITKKKNY